MFSVKRLQLLLIGLLPLLFMVPTITFAQYCGDGALNEALGEQCDDGNFISRDGCSAYCEIEDMDPPTVESVSIANEATGIATTLSQLTIVFSEPVDAETINDFNVRLEHSTEPLDITVSLNSDGKTATVTINQDLFSQSRHAVRVKYVKDTSTNIMEGEFVTVFDTAVAIDDDAPNVVINPPGGTYHFSQKIDMTPYIGEYTNSEEFIDETAKIYYTLNGLDPTPSSTLYELSLTLESNTTLRFIAKDENGNTTPIQTHSYYFECAERLNAKSVTRYPGCKVEECNIGFLLKSNTCVPRLGDADPDDYKINAITAPMFGSDTPMIITTKPAIYITKQHKGVIPRPIIFKDSKRGTIIEFERDTKITTADGRPFDGYITPPRNLYMKDFPINFGYTFKSIFDFKDAEGNELNFHPPYSITIPYTTAFTANETSFVFTYDPGTDQFTPYPTSQYSVNLSKGEVTVKAPQTGTFFVAQTGKNYNEAVFRDTLNHWSKNYVEALYRRGIVKGRSKDIYAPDQPLTRAEFTKIALKAIDAETEDPEMINYTHFRDVPLYAWYSVYVKKAWELGLVKGYENRFFRPEKFINRAEAIKILISALEFDLDLPSEDADSPSATNFPDVERNAWYFPYVDFAVRHKIVSGIQLKNSTVLKDFGPGRSITRGEMAKLAIKAIELKESIEDAKKKF